MRLKDKVVLVTGGNSGIGRGIVREAIKEGARVAFAGRDAAKGADTLAEMQSGGAEVAFFPGDLSVEAEAEALVRDAEARFGRIDVVVNNAGVGARRSGVLPEDPPGVRLRKVLGPTLEATYYVSAYAMPVLRKAGGGAIVNVSSTASLHGNWGTYGVAKAGIEALTRALAVEGAPYGIRANALSPGWINTDTARSAGAPQSWEKDVSLFGRMGTLEEMAKAVMFFASADSSFITGMTLVIDGGFTIVDYPALPWLERVGASKLFPGTVASPS
jgi:NAD(P)-dependent dehydrogenase (short-subunit alcohol dehydrogenase family)